MIKSLLNFFSAQWEKTVTVFMSYKLLKLRIFDLILCSFWLKVKLGLGLEKVYIANLHLSRYILQCINGKTWFTFWCALQKISCWVKSCWNYIYLILFCVVSDSIIIFIRLIFLDHFLQCKMCSCSLHCKNDTVMIKNVLEFKILKLILSNSDNIGLSDFCP